MNETATNHSIVIMQTVSVGIMSGTALDFCFNGDYCVAASVVANRQHVELSGNKILWNNHAYKSLVFSPHSSESTFILHDVTIGVNFHWERREQQTFEGELHLIIDNDVIRAVNVVPIENYLRSVIASEMRADASIELLKAHAVISRSWLLVQQRQRKEAIKIEQTLTNGVQPASNDSRKLYDSDGKEIGMLRWYDRSQHQLFDVCADDHCQRYQGIARIGNPRALQAIEETHGEVLKYGDEICDARFSKCCGGQTEEFQYCWDDTPKEYLTSIKDNYCNTQDEAILRQVLNDYDLETKDFHDWTVEYSVEDVNRLIKGKLPIDIGSVIDIVPIEYGKSGRIVALKLVGTHSDYVVGKELEIRRLLSESHLKSSWFGIEKKTDAQGNATGFILHGHGWGHGVGLCQIGAAVMGEKGFTYKEILQYYYPNTDIVQMW